MSVFGDWQGGQLTLRATIDRAAGILRRRQALLERRGHADPDLAEALACLEGARG